MSKRHQLVPRAEGTASAKAQRWTNELVQKQYHCSWRRVTSHFSSLYYFNFYKIIMIIIAVNVYLVFTL